MSAGLQSERPARLRSARRTSEARSPGKPVPPPRTTKVMDIPDHIRELGGEG